MLDNTTVVIVAGAVVGLTLLVIFLMTETRSPLATEPQPAWRNLWNPLASRDPDGASFWFTVFALSVGLGVATPWIATTALPFGAPDNLVGLVLAVAGSFKLLAMARDYHRFYAFSVFFEMVVWLSLAWSGLTTRPDGAAWLIYGPLSLADLWVLARLFIDDSRLKVRVEHEAQREATNTVPC